MKGLKLFEDNLHLLEEVFSKKIVDERIKRLREIFEITERKWLENTVQLGFNKVKYLLICEAPPYSEDGDPIYFYSQSNSSFHSRIWKSVFPTIQKPKDKEETYRMLADKGFLLVDSIPFPMKYDSLHRKKDAYAEIIKKALPNLISNIEDNFEVDPDLRIAFGFKLNAMQFIKITNGKLRIRNVELSFDENNIATDGSGFTNSNKLRKIMGLSES